MAGAAWPSAAQAIPVGPDCPALYVLAVQGTGQSSPTADPTADTGVVGAVLGPVVAAVPGLVQRAYIGYGAGFGGVVPGGSPAPYVESVTDAVDNLTAASAQVAAVCPDTLQAAVGYSQGAQAVSVFAQRVGAHAGPVPPERVAAIVLYSDPDRPTGSPPFPGRPGQSSPDPAPGTSGSAVSAVTITGPSAPGSGIAADGAEFGALTGRVAEICTDGDLACAAPEHAALLRFGALLAARADLRDPLAALGSLNTLLSQALGQAWTTILAEDVAADPPSDTYQPRKPLAQRLIDAADPRIGSPGPDQVATAAERWAQITAAAVANPAGVVPVLAGQLSAAWGQLIADNAALTDPAVWGRFAGAVAAHTGYAATGQLASGIAWLIAVAHDIAGRTP
ncbi:cutinase family protein [Nocardia blacklockiae]|nr:cutinase family protein [Nocardia blacklockiae]